MNTKLIRSAVVAILALGSGLGTSAAIAQVGGVGTPYPDQGYGRADQGAVPYDRFGHYSCGYNELHTRLERKNCGGTHYRY